MFNKMMEYFRDVRVEMMKVTWPAREDLINSTIVVIVVSVAFALFIFSADWGLNRLIGLVLNMK